MFPQKRSLLLRKLSFDLIGLPPHSGKNWISFLQNDDANAYEIHRR